MPRGSKTSLKAGKIVWLPSSIVMTMLALPSILPGDGVVEAHEFVAHRRDLVELLGELLLRIVDVGFAVAEEGMVVEDDDLAFGRQRAMPDEYRSQCQC